MYVDFHGFLPTPEEVEPFVTGNDPRAYENLLDELLSSPRYGERWARHWLDVIHFADSHGCEHDVKRPHAWRFRDYVINRLNADVPWDRFIREQLAADAFFADEPRLTAALGFIAAGPLELSRATTAPVTFDYLDRDDMVTQTMAAFVSTTANCARCHTHKFDLITKEDYYALEAVFAGVVNGWVEAQRSNPVKWRILQPVVFVASSGATLTKQPDDSIVASGEIADQEVYTVTSPVDLKRLTAVRLEVLADERLPKGGPGRAKNGNLHLSEVDIRWFSVDADASTRLKISRATADFDQDGWTSAEAIDGDPTTGWAIFPKVNESHHIVFEFAEPVDVKRGGTLAVALTQQHPPEHAIGHFRLAVTDAERGEARALPREVIEGLAKAAERRTRAESVAIAALALESDAKQRFVELPPRRVVCGVSPFWSRAKNRSAPQRPKVVHLLRRGDIEKPVREVVPGALSAIEALPGRFDLADSDRESSRRAALADWLAPPDNPLTWRSIVNRVWHYHFGRGLCDTPNDLMKSPFKFKQHGESGRWVSSVFPHQAKWVDEMAFLMAMTTKTNVHGPATYMMNSGFLLPGFPCLGAWTSYALGNLTDNLPAFVVLPDAKGLPYNQRGPFSAGFLPSVHQGTVICTGSAERLVSVVRSKLLGGGEFLGGVCLQGRHPVGRVGHHRCRCATFFRYRFARTRQPLDGRPPVTAASSRECSRA